MGTVSDFLSADKRRLSIYSFINNASAKGTVEIHIEQICSSFQYDYLRITKDLDAMIKNPSQYRLLKNAYIDASKKTLILSPMKDQSVTGQLKSMVDDVSDSLLGRKFFAQKIDDKNAVSTLICKSCGAANTVVEGRDNDCEYCGAPINY